MENTIYNFFQFHKNQKTGTVFHKMVLLLIIYSTVLLIFVFSLESIAIRQQTREQTQLTYENLLHTTIGSIDSAITEIHEIGVQLSCEPLLTSTVVNHSSNYSKTKSELAITASRHSLIDNVHLYIPRRNKVIDSAYSECNIKKSDFFDIIFHYLKKNKSMYPIYYNGCITKLFFYEDRMFLAREFPTSGKGKLGILFFEINTDLFAGQIDSLHRSGTDLLVLDHQQLLLSQYSVPDTEELSRIREEMTVQDLSVYQKNGRTCLLAASQLSGWNYYILFQDTPLFQTRDIFLYIIPLELGIIICCFLLAFALNRHFVKPLESITRLATEGTDRALSIPPMKHREFSILQQAMTGYIASSNQLQNSIQNIISHISDNFFVDLCEGKQMDDAYINTCLKHMNSPIDTLGYYGIILYQIREQYYSNAPEQILKRKIEEYMQSVDPASCRYHIQVCHMLQIMLILEFDKTISLSQFDLHLRKIRHDTVSCLEGTNISFTIGSSSICYSIKEIYYGYRDVSKYLEKTEQSPDTAATAETGTPDQHISTESYNYDQLSSSVQRILTALLEKDRDVSLHILSSLLDNWKADISDLQPFQDLCMQYIHTLFSHMITLDILDAKAFFNSSTIENRLKDTTSISETAALVFDFSQECFSLVEASQKKKNHKYIVAAQNYIETYYMNPNLSLDIVAEHIHANPSYISKLFKNNLNINFVSYLNSYRIKEAKKLLLSSDLSIKTISAQSGFNSEQNFIRVFKKHMQMTPTQYRANRPSD